MRTRQSERPAWMPPENTISVVAAGRWWDAVVVPQQRGLDALEVIDQTTGHAPGPVVWDQNAAGPRLYFLVPLGTAESWRVEGTQALGAGCYVGLPGWTTLEPPGLFWLCPPDPDKPDQLVDAEALRSALEVLGAAA